MQISQHRCSLRVPGLFAPPLSAQCCAALRSVSPATYYKPPFRTRHLAYIDYVVGRKNGYYPPNASPNFINKTKPELVLSPPKLCDVYKEELLREIARQNIRQFCQN